MITGQRVLVLLWFHRLKNFIYLSYVKNLKFQITGPRVNWSAVNSIPLKKL